MALDILKTAFYIFGYGSFFIIALEVDVKNKTAYYVMMIPFLIITLFMILAEIYLIWWR